jgi:protein-glutamine gamma-glutamyltransferase
MSLTLIFQASLYAMVLLAAVTLAVAAEYPVPSLLTLPIAIATFVFVDRKRLFHLPDLFANLVGAIAIAITVWGVIGAGDVLKQVVAGANLLVYLTWVVLAQRKWLRQYWYLAALAWLQMAVASILSSSGWLGVLLFLFMPLAVWTLSLFALYQGAVEVVGEKRLIESESLTTDARISAEWVGDGTRGDHTPSRSSWGPTRLRPTIQHDDREWWITPRYAAGVFGIAMFGFVIGFAFFLFTPRFWMGEFSGMLPRHEGPGVMNLTGFTGDVKLGDMGTILENPQPVMKLRLFDRTTETDTELPFAQFLSRFELDAPLFRGNVLDSYERGKWQQLDKSRDIRELSRSTRTWFAEGADPHPLRLEITLQPTGTRYLFTQEPFVSLRIANGSGKVPMRASSSVAIFDRRTPNDPFEYYLYFPASRKQSDPHREVTDGGLLDWDRIFPPIRALYTTVPANLPVLVELAQRVNDEAIAAGATTARARAEALVKHLRDSGLYSYSLDSSITDATIDPIEDFLKNRRKGHCEYYASSLALMLRAAGIPSRMVTGFKGSVENTLGGYEEVQQRHAHAWVEAWLDDHWAVLDATPAARDEEVEEFGKSFDPFGNLAGALQTIWNEYVVSLNQQRQEQMFLDPLRESAGAVEERARASGNVFAAIFEVFKRMLLSGGVMMLVPLAVAGAFVAAVVALWNPIKRALALILSSLGGTAAKSQKRGRMMVPFVVKFERLAKRAGCVPTDWQTTREFCGEVSTRLRELDVPEGPGVAERVRDLFEGLRYGDAPVPEMDAAALEAEVDRLDRVLAEREAAADR